jgi:hypothetical protein
MTSTAPAPVQTKQRALLAVIVSTSKHLKTEQQEALNLLKQARLSLEGAAKLQARISVIDIQLKALSAEQNQVEKLLKAA